MKNRAGRLRRAIEYLGTDFEYMHGADGAGPSLDYDAYWERRLREGFVGHPLIEQHRRRLIADFVGEGSSVLDIGCGDGSLLAHLQQAKSVRAKGMDISQVSCRLASEKGLEVVQADINREDTPIPTADHIIISQVLEHLPNPESLLLRLKGKFVKSVLVDVPNTGVVSDRLRLLFGRFPKQWVLHPAEHLRFWTVRDFHSMCHQIGYTVERFDGIYDPYFDTLVPLWKISPALFARYVLYILHERTAASS